jgi:S-DNA-T family DNA segregation ATPase FtsK/SpoIIIE
MNNEDEKNGNSFDEIYPEVVRAVLATGYVSISNIQRQFTIGYNRAARLVEDMEKNGIVSKPDYVGKRTILNT